MQVISLLFLLFATVALSDSGIDYLNTPSSGWDVTAGKDLALTWDAQSKGDISIFLLPYNTGIGGAWEDRIDIGLTDIANSGSGTAKIPGNVSTDDAYIFELVDLTRFNENNASAWPSNNATNDSSAFRINPKAGGISKHALAGAIAGGVIGFILVISVIILFMTRKIRRAKNESADLTWFPFPHRDMQEKRRHDPEAPHTPTKTISSSEMTSPTSDFSSGKKVSPRDMTNEKTTSNQAPPPQWNLRGNIDHEVNHDA